MLSEELSNPNLYSSAERLSEVIIVMMLPPSRVPTRLLGIFRDGMSSLPPPPVIQPGSGSAIIVNPVQRTNPLLEAIRNVPKEYGDIIPDFQVGRTTSVLYLSLKYHRLHPEYIHKRIEKLGHMYNLRILLIMCDISESREPIRELTKTCLINNITVVVAWSLDEAAQYLSTFKQFEHKPPDLIKERVDKDYHSILRSALTSVKGINKTDVETLRSNCKSFAGISRASEQKLLNLPGLAQTKVRRLRETFHKPFWNDAAGEQPSVLGAATQLKDVDDGGVSSSGSSKRARAPRAASPVWDIELDLNDSESEHEEEPTSKKLKGDHPFGEPSGLLKPG